MPGKVILGSLRVEELDKTREQEEEIMVRGLRSGSIWAEGATLEIWV